MIKEIAFAEPTFYQGRSGVGNQHGIQILDVRTFPIELRPINSRLDPVDKCVIRVDRDALPALIAHLSRIVDGGTEAGVAEYLKPIT